MTTNALQLLTPLIPACRVGRTRPLSLPPKWLIILPHLLEQGLLGLTLITLYLTSLRTTPVIARARLSYEKQITNAPFGLERGNELTPLLIVGAPSYERKAKSSTVNKYPSPTITPTQAPGPLLANPHSLSRPLHSYPDSRLVILIPPKLDTGKRAPLRRLILGRRTIAMLLFSPPSTLVYPCTRRRWCAYLQSLGRLLALGRPLLQQTTTGTLTHSPKIVTGILTFLAPPDCAKIPFLLGIRLAGKGISLLGLHVITVPTPPAPSKAN